MIDVVGMRGGMSGAMRPVLNLFYVLDTSGSMRGDPITQLNRAMRTTLDAVRDENQYNNQAQVKVSVLEFNSNCRWLNPHAAEDLDTFIYDNLAAGGGTNVGAAIKELNSKLSQKEFLHSESGNLLPIIIFMTDGYPTDPDEWPRELEKALHNKWFSRATRIGFAIGRRPDQETIARLAGSAEHVIHTQDLGDFALLLRWASVTSTMMQSQSSIADGQPSASDMINEAKRRAGFTEYDFRPDIDDYVEEPMPEATWGPEDESNLFDVNSNDYGIGTAW